jgi:hypothetical protein
VEKQKETAESLGVYVIHTSTRSVDQSESRVMYSGDDGGCTTCDILVKTALCYKVVSIQIKLGVGVTYNEL